MNWSLASLRIQLALAKFRRYSNNGMDDRAYWDRRVGDLEYELASLDCLPGSSFGRTANALPSSFIQGLPQCAEVKSGDRCHPKILPDAVVQRDAIGMQVVA